MLPLTPLIHLIGLQSSKPCSPALRTLTETLLQRYGDAVQAVLFYGSCLRSGDDLNGLVDLYVIVDSYRRTYRKRSLRIFNALLPPNVFYLEVPYENRAIRAKYAILSMQDLQRGTSMRWFHSYLWGRFAQPTSVLYVRSGDIATQIHTALAQAVVTFITRVLPQLPERFEATEVWRRGLALSYRSELRAEKPERVKQLVEAFQPSCEPLTAAAMTAVPYVVGVEPGNPAVRYRAAIPRRLRYRSRMAWALRRIQGKLLSVLRLVKAAFTFDGGIDYIAWKLERHSGVPIEVTPRLRRYPLLLIWGLFWRLYRRGVFR